MRLFETVRTDAVLSAALVNNGLTVEHMVDQLTHYQNDGAWGLNITPEQASPYIMLYRKQITLRWPSTPSPPGYYSVCSECGDDHYTNSFYYKIDRHGSKLSIVDLERYDARYRRLIGRPLSREFSRIAGAKSMMITDVTLEEKKMRKWPICPATLIWVRPA